MVKSDPYVQKSGVLKNKLNIKNEEKLKLAESDIVITRIHEYFSNMSFSRTKEFYLSLHKHLFGDIYPFAGEIRTVNIEKQETNDKPGKIICSAWPSCFNIQRAHANH